MNKFSSKCSFIVLFFLDISDAGFELSTMFNSMNTSMLIAQECLKNEPEEDTTYQGLETFAATIDSSKRKIRFLFIYVDFLLKFLLEFV
jgi:hypothetical protein